MGIQQQIDRLGPWLHNLHLPGGVQTAPGHGGDIQALRWREIGAALPDDLRGWSALDIGCSAGFHAFELAKRGAQVMGIDTDSRCLRQAHWAAGRLGLRDRVCFRQMQVYDLPSLPQMFDLVLFMGVFHRLRYPLLALDIVAQATRGTLLFQTLTMPGDEAVEDTHGRSPDPRSDLQEPGWPKMAFLEGPFGGDPSCWWAPDRAAVEAMLRSSGLRVTGRPGHDCYLCAPDPERPSCVTTWNQDEMMAAIGRTAGRTRTLQFKNCRVSVYDGYTETLFGDGTKVGAAPQDTSEYLANAARFGYGTDIGAVSREHEVLHTFLAECLGHDVSPTLWAVAHDQTGSVAPVWEQEIEEGLVLAFQRYLNGEAPDGELGVLSERGFDLSELRSEAEALLRP